MMAIYNIVLGWIKVLRYSEQGTSKKRPMDLAESKQVLNINFKENI